MTEGASKSAAIFGRREHAECAANFRAGRAGEKAGAYTTVCDRLDEKFNKAIGMRNSSKKGPRGKWVPGARTQLAITQWFQGISTASGSSSIASLLILESAALGNSESRKR